MAGCARSNIVHDKSNEAGQVELPSNVSDGLTNAWMSSQTMVMIGTEDVGVERQVSGIVYAG